MTRRLLFEDRETHPSHPEPTSHHPAGDPPTHVVSPPAAVLPTPLRTIAAATLGGLAGFLVIYGVSRLLADTVAAVAVIAVVFAVTMAGPWVHARSDRDRGRALAVGLQSIAFGGALAAVLIVT